MFYIEVPDENDSIAHIAFLGEPYVIRFTWNRYGGFWNFGLLDKDYNPIIGMTRIVPNVPINFYFTEQAVPKGYFFAEVDSGEEIGREDFKDGKAKFGFIAFSEFSEG